MIGILAEQKMLKGEFVAEPDAEATTGRSVADPVAESRTWPEAEARIGRSEAAAADVSTGMPEADAVTCPRVAAAVHSTALQAQ